MKMQNKKSKQAEQREKHRQELRDAKRRKRGQDNSLETPRELKLEKPTFLIVCEGENTEPSYFNKFKLKSAEIITVGEGYNTVSLVKRAEKLAQNKAYDHVWCVFDKDDFTDQNFNDAVQRAESNGFELAWSNQSFEYWFILHFNDHNGSSVHRCKYNGMINTYLKDYGIEYDGKGDKLVNDDFFTAMQAFDLQYKKRRIDLAILRASRIASQIRRQSPAKSESATMVYNLVKEILKYM